MWDSWSFLIRLELQVASRHQTILLHDLDIKCRALLRSDSFTAHGGTHRVHLTSFRPMCFKDTIRFTIQPVASLCCHNLPRLDLLSRSCRFRCCFDVIYTFIALKFHHIPYMHICHNWTQPCRVWGQPRTPPPSKINTFSMKMVTKSFFTIRDKLGVRGAGVTFSWENDVVFQSSVSAVNIYARQRCLFKWQETLFQEQSMSAEMNCAQLKIEALF